MAKHNVTVYRDSESWSTTSILDNRTEVCDGVLTDEHPRSSYGLPVLVLEDGTVMGPGDVAAKTGHWQVACGQNHHMGEGTTEERRLCDAWHEMVRQIEVA